MSKHSSFRFRMKLLVRLSRRSRKLPRASPTFSEFRNRFVRAVVYGLARSGFVGGFREEEDVGSTLSKIRFDQPAGCVC